MTTPRTRTPEQVKLVDRTGKEISIEEWEISPEVEAKVRAVFRRAARRLLREQLEEQKPRR